MRVKSSSLFLILYFKTFLSQCLCFSLQRHHFERTILRNSIRCRPSVTRLFIFPRNDAPGGNSSNQSSGSNLVNNGYLDSLSSAYAHEDDDSEEEDSKPEVWKDPFSSATSAFSNVVRTGSNDIKSAANAATTGIGNAASAVTKTVGTGANAATTGFGSAASAVTNVVGAGANGIKSATNTATTGIGAVAQRGTSNIQSFANTATFNVKREAVKVRSFARKGTGKVGDVALWIDSQAKMGTQAIGSQARSMVVKFTGKEDYEFGDIAKETLRRILEGDVSISDTILLLKILLAIGASIGPLAELLPVAVLLQGLNVSLETQIGGKILEALAHSLDNRFVAAFTGDDKFLLGAAAKRSMLSGILAFTGKSTYEAGDIQRTIEAGTSDGHEQLNISVDPELEAWDNAFTESIELQKQREQVALLYSNPDGTPLDEDSAKELDMQLASELEEWSSVFRKDYADYGL
mmetsp:Transcript_41772/g.100599  ORF Transcript_41772/g.100599 Transcript_41772/m.100599 type:complete len:463 (+) Transcript_41772:117-1505(+)